MADFISNGESGSSVRSKLNLAPTALGTVTSGTQNIDGTASRKYTITVGGAFTITATWPTGYGEIEILMTNGGSSAVTWPTVSWLKGDGTNSTTFSTMGVTLYTSGVNSIMLWSWDAGTTVYGRAA
jgi:hypothetical protein